MSLPKIFIYPDYDLSYEWPYFEEATHVQNLFFKYIQLYPIVSKIEEADLAFFPLTLATAFQQQRTAYLALSKRPNIPYLWRTEYEKRIAPISIRQKVKHFLLLSYVLYNIQLNFVPRDFTILAYETEITLDIHGTLADFGCNNRIMTIPYYVPCLSAAIKNKKYLYIGYSNHAQHWRANMVSFFQREWGCDCIEPKKDMNFTKEYSEYDFALVLRGDTPTRCAFYNAIQAECIPIVYQHCLLDYGFLYNGLLPIHDMCLVLPNLPQEWNSHYEHQIVFLMQDFVSNRMQKVKTTIRSFKHMLSYDNFIHTEDAWIPAPIYFALDQIQSDVRHFEPNTPIVFIPPLPSEYNVDFLPTVVSERDMVKGDFTSQYELEIYWHRSLLQSFLITHVLEKADVVFIPFYTFLSGWKKKQFSNSRIVDAINELLTFLPSWSKNEKPHLLIYSDVCWDTDDSFVNKITWPTCTILISLESYLKTDLRMITSPYLPGWTDLHGIENQYRPIFLSYIGRMRWPFQNGEETSERCEFHFIEMPGWKSINDLDFLDWCKSKYSMSTFSLCPPGDRQTRRGFFQSLLCGCVPVIFESNKEGYQQHTTIDIGTLAIVLPTEIENIEQIVSYLKTINKQDRFRWKQNGFQCIQNYVFDDACKPIWNVLNQIL